MPGATIIGNAPFTAADHVKLEDLPLGPLISVHVDLYLPYLLKGISIKTFVSKNLYIGTFIYIYIYIPGSYNYVSSWNCLHPRISRRWDDGYETPARLREPEFFSLEFYLNVLLLFIWCIFCLVHVLRGSCFLFRIETKTCGDPRVRPDLGGDIKDRKTSCHLAWGAVSGDCDFPY